MDIKSVIAAVRSTDVSDFKTFDPGMGRKSDPSELREFLERKEQLGIMLSKADNDEEHVYSKIFKGNKEVATVYDTGVIKTLNQYQGVNLTSSGDRLEIAERRTQELLEAIQGAYTVRKS